MKKLLLLSLALCFAPSVAHAQVSIHFGWAAPPPLVEVSPGVQVVEDGGEEVFFTNGHYWIERDGRWFWANDFHEHWIPVRGEVPLFLRNHHRGQYLHWRAAEHRAAVRAEERHEVRAEERHEVRAEERHDEHAREREAEHHEERREERREEEHHEH